MVLTLGILMDTFFVGLLAWCAYTDLKRREINNATILAMLLLGIVKVIVFIVWGIAWWQYPAGIVLVVPFFIVWLRNGMGAGDVKLIITTTLYLGLSNMIIAFALMVPVLVILMIWLISKNKTLNRRIPFAPVITVGASGALLIGYFCILMQIS